MQLVALAILLSGQPAEPQQTEARPLSPPTALRGVPLASGEAALYGIPLLSGQALLGSVEQRGIDVLVVLRDPSGAIVLQVDSPNGIAGPEPVAHVARVSGNFTLEVRSFEERAAEGTYDLTLESVRTAGQRERDAAEELVLRLNAFRDRTAALRLKGEANHPEASRLYELAARDAATALRLLERNGRKRSLEAAAVHQVIGLIDDERGDYAKGQRHFEEALRIQERAYGAEDPRTFTTRSDLAYLTLAAGHAERAAGLFARVAAQREKAFGPEHPSVGNALTGLGEACLEQGDLKRAESAFRRALAIREKAGDGGGPRYDHWTRLGSVLVAAGRLEEGEDLCARSLGAAQEAKPPSRGRIALAHACLGEALRLSGRADAAIPHLEETLRYREAADGPDAPATAKALTRLASGLAAAGRLDESRALLERARAIQAARRRRLSSLRE